MKWIFYLIAMLPLMIGCHKTQKSDDKRVIEVINVAPNENCKLKLSEVIADIKIIPLKTNDSTIVDRIGKIKKVGNKFYINCLDAIRVFDEEGNFIRQIGSKGKGPKEILSATNFDVNQLENRIEIYDAVRGQNICYDLEGSVTDVLKHGYDYGYDFIKTRHGGYFFYLGFGNKNRGEVIYSSNIKNANFKNLLQYDEQLAKYLHFGDLVNFASNKYGTYFTRSFNNNIYELKDDSLAVKYRVDFGKNNLPDNLLYGNYSDVRAFMMRCLETDYAFRLIGFFEMKNKILFGFHWNKKIWNAIYDKRTHKCTVIASFIDDIYNTNIEIDSDIQLLPKGFDDQKIYLAIDAYRVKEMVAHLNKSELTDKSKLADLIRDMQLNAIKESDNPVILEIQLK